jgi:hypothetical protein
MESFRRFPNVLYINKNSKIMIKFKHNNIYHYIDKDLVNNSLNDLFIFMDFLYTVVPPNIPPNLLLSHVHDFMRDINKNLYEYTIVSKLGNYEYDDKNKKIIVKIQKIVEYMVQSVKINFAVLELTIAADYLRNYEAFFRHKSGCEIRIFDSKESYETFLSIAEDIKEAIELYVHNFKA